MEKNDSIDFYGGEVLLIDKPKDISSFGAVNRIKRAFIKQTGKKRYKIGHAGTLDPLATGLLIMCSGKKTKTISGFQGLPKEYTGEIVLGATTPCYDLEMEIDQTFDYSQITEQQILDCAKIFLGENNQMPPIFSAKKINGKRAYDLARNGEEVVLKPNLITIHEFEIVKIEMPKVSFRIACSKGTYIRSIAHDFGKKLNNGGYLENLRRTKIGEYSVEDAKSIEEIQDLIFDSEFVEKLN
jgi:tRNA pseudouridine55 synthase|tara:strand:+ start:3958 stop:4680 length:723 start_codon:yes stop_codon:yes gene_type:complete